MAEALEGAPDIMEWWGDLLQQRKSALAQHQRSLDIYDRCVQGDYYEV